MNNYCTLFDSNYLSRGLAMYESLIDQSSDFHLYIFAFDDLTLDILLKLGLEKVTVVSLAEFETDELRAVKKERSTAEYCWTCTPSIISYVLSTYNTRDCTYIDSDLYFYSDPSVLISELDQNCKNVLITEHRFSFLPRLYEEHRAGRFCVQFMTFRNEKSSLEVLDKWRNQCINWCYSRYEDGKFGDQKYLDEWPAVYHNINILNHPGGGIAPWNIQKYRFAKNNKLITGTVKNSGVSFNAIFYHFQYVKLLADGSYDIGWYFISSEMKKLFYIPYLLRIENIEKRIKNQNSKYQAGIFIFKKDNLKNKIKSQFKRIFSYNILKLTD